MTYKMDYEANSSGQQANRHDDEYRPRHYEREYTPKREFRLPSIVKTTAVFLTGAVALFTWETMAPEGYRVSTVMGTYDARVAAAVKAAELQQQGRYDAWAAQVKVAAEQNAEQYKAQTQGILANYNATYDRAKIWAQAAAQMQGNYVSVMMNQKTAEQGSDIGIINMTRLFGRVMNGIEPGSGDGALDYSKDLSGELSNEMTDVARQGARMDITDWDMGLAKPGDVQAAIATIKPLVLPSPPSLTEPVAKIADPMKGQR